MKPLVMDSRFFTLSLSLIGVGCILATIGSGFLLIAGIVGVGTFVLKRGV